MKIYNTNKGITLISLIITILVLIILAGVSISLLDGDNGTVKKAGDAKEEYETALKKEENELSKWQDRIDAYLSNNGNENTNVKIAQIIEPKNYGDPIKYSANGIENWKIFYNDGTYVYIIATDYLENEYLPVNARVSKLEGYPHSAYWKSDGDELNDLVGARNIDAAVANKYKLNWLNSYPESTNKNIKAVSTLLDTEVWKVFVDTKYAESAIATPTLDMFAESWNQKYSDGTQLYYDCMSDVGYYVTTISPEERTDEVTTTYTSLSQETGYDETLYFPYKDTHNNSNGYWLSSPSSYVVQGEQAVAYVYRTGIIGASQDGCCGSGSSETAGADFGLRPVVCLKEDISIEKVDDTWEIILPN